MRLANHDQQSRQYKKSSGQKCVQHPVIGMLILASFLFVTNESLAQGSGHDSAKNSGHGSAEKNVAGGNDGFTNIFDGKTLDGWSGNSTLWSVQDGAITGTTAPETKLTKNQFLTWTGGQLQDFELRVKFKIESGNSGIQFRSKSVDKPETYRVHGYQADIDSTMRYMGILYEEGGRGILAERGKKVVIDSEGKKNVVGTTGQDKQITDAIDANDWNEYVIIAKGNHITQSINGHLCVDLTDDQVSAAARSGILAFQIHVGPPMKVQFKDVRLKHLGQ